MAEIQLPGKSLIEAYPTGGEVSMSAAAAPARALAQVGNAIQGLGEQGLQMVEEHHKVDNLRMANEMELRANELYSQFQVDTANDNDPKTLPARWTKTLQDFSSQNIGKNLTPAQKAVIGERFSQFASNTTINVAKNAFQENVRQSKLSSSNIIEQSLRMGMPERGMSEIDSMVGARIITAAEGETLRMDYQQKTETNQVEAMAKLDPMGTQEQLDAKDASGGWTNFKNLDPNSRARMSKMTQGYAREAMSDAVDHANDSMADGSITTPEQLKAKVGGLVPPRVLEHLQGELAKRWDAATIAERAQPAYQEKVVGEMSAMLSGFNPEDPEYDKKFVEMSSLVSTLPSGAVKETLNSQLKNARKGPADDKTYGEYVLRQMDERNSAVKRVEPDKIKVLDLAKAGYLKDEPKSMRQGFSASQAKKIKDAADESPEAGQKMFNDLWKDRPNGSLQASEFEIATGKALRMGNATVDWNDPTSETAAMTANNAISQTQGIAKMKMIQFLRLKPEASQAEIDEKFTQYTGEHVRLQASGGLLGTRPTMGGDNTASDTLLPPKSGIKLSNYGYPSDTTPDTNSANGIGHRNNSLIAGESAAISKSLADRLNLKHGDKVKVETTKGDFEVFYHDTVPSTDSRTGDLPETIDIYRPKDGSNSWGGNVTGVTKITK